MNGCRLLTIVLLLILSLSACQSRQSESADLDGRHVSVGLALARGGLGDKGFNDSAYAGLQRAQRERGIRFSVQELKAGDEAAEINLRQLVLAKHNLIITIGNEYLVPLKAIAAEYPEQRFAIVDAQVDAPNITSLVFDESQGDFLAGALSALMSPSGTVGFLGGAETDVIRRIEAGWVQGVQHINPDAVILVTYAAGPDDFSGFAKPDLGQQLTAQLYSDGAEIVYSAAGRTSLGSIDAAKQHQRYVITTGTDLRYLAPEHVITSRTKNVDVVVETAINDYLAGSLAPGRRVFDLITKGISLAPVDSSIVPEDVQQQIEQLRIELERGALTVNIKQ